MDENNHQIQTNFVTVIQCSNEVILPAANVSASEEIVPEAPDNRAVVLTSTAIARQNNQNQYSTEKDYAILQSGEAHSHINNKKPYCTVEANAAREKAWKIIVQEALSDENEVRDNENEQYGNIEFCAIPQAGEVNPLVLEDIVLEAPVNQTKMLTNAGQPKSNNQKQYWTGKDKAIPQVKANNQLAAREDLWQAIVREALDENEELPTASKDQNNNPNQYEQITVNAVSQVGAPDTFIENRHAREEIVPESLIYHNMQSSVGTFIIPEPRPRIWARNDTPARIRNHRKAKKPKKN